ncbi:hypothetical protein BXZ70DRAFT_909828 [Cristinia sonorae]|uniref:Uncharacterized protein n=1 Tax=Cristinia sonorae TaxID=1940300 RepID=A0A8K0UGY4_9AGAR|nr:hypothetical protein BXZ70DRAFT_909828 [Cristinia sonorae]
MRSFITAIALAVLSTVFASEPVSGDVSALCQDPAVISESFIGENKDVKMTAYSCSNVVSPNGGGGNGTSNASPSPRAFDDFENTLTKRATNVCGATCDTHCFNPAGGGPDPNECHVISDALRYNGQNLGNVFNIPNNANVVRMQYASCYSFFVNQANQDLQYCRNDWASVLDYVAYNCQAQQNAHGGLCVARSQQWFIQIQHS